MRWMADGLTRFVRLPAGLRLVIEPGAGGSFRADLVFDANPEAGHARVGAYPSLRLAQLRAPRAASRLLELAAAELNNVAPPVNKP